MESHEFILGSASSDDSADDEKRDATTKQPESCRMMSCMMIFSLQNNK
jgi:hypothetical protein